MRGPGREGGGGAARAAPLRLPSQPHRSLAPFPCAPLVASRGAGRAAMAVMPLFRARKAGAPPASPAKKATGFAAAAANAMTKAAANPYEAERNARIAANLAKMKQFKLFDAKQKLEVRH